MSEKEKAELKDIEVEKSGGSKLVKVTYEKGGKEYVFHAKAVDVLNEETFKSLQDVWVNKAIPDKEAEAEMSDENFGGKLRELKEKILKRPQNR